MKRHKWGTEEHGHWTCEDCGCVYVPSNRTFRYFTRHGFRTEFAPGCNPNSRSIDSTTKDRSAIKQ